MTHRCHEPTISSWQPGDKQVKSEQIIMTAAKYRIVSDHSIMGRFLPVSGSSEILLKDRALAVVIAAKSITQPYGQEIRVVHVPTGEVIYRKTAAHTLACND